MSTPWLIWIAWMVVVLGIEGTVRYWVEYPSVMRAANGGLASAQVPLSTAFAQIFKILNTKGVLVFLAGAVCSAHLARKEPWFRPVFAFAAVHLAWWLTAASSPAPRYFVPCYLVFCLALQWVLLGWLGRIRTVPRWNRGHQAVILLVIFGVLGSRIGPEYRRIFADPEGYGFPQQLILQRQWASLAEEAGNRVVSTQPEYVHDLAVLFTAPHQVERATPQTLQRSIRSGTWFLFGEYTEPSVSAVLLDSKCVKRQGLKAGSQGFWECK